ncbi:hypothetical protein [Pseudomonas sp. KB-10]|uniref:hypothetical protein n=1 Tax=Pseudomonas sp. KB-10 TaxID=2292264 RepID=UPI001BB07F52|nr:hypothetical protein [Pseudomonas sp. KB-10]
MNTRLYIYASGIESSILAMSKKINWPESSIRHSSIDTNRWTWRTKHEQCGNFPEEDLLIFLRKHKEKLIKLSNCRPSLQELSVMIVSEATPEDPHRGYSITSELIAALHQLNLSLEIDVVPGL